MSCKDLPPPLKNTVHETGEFTSFLIITALLRFTNKQWCVKVKQEHSLKDQLCVTL